MGENNALLQLRKNRACSWNCSEKGVLLCLGSVQKCRKVKDSSGLNHAGSVEGQKVTNSLLDTGCSQTVVKKWWGVPQETIGGKIVSVRCVHSDTELYLLADIRMQVDGIPFRVEVAMAGYFTC